MKVSVTFKDPDVVSDTVDGAVRASLKDSGLPEDEQRAVFETRRDKVTAAIDKWVTYGEYITVDFDTDAGTATVRRRA